MITESLIDEYACDVASWLTGLYTPDFPMAHLGAVASDVSNKLRLLSCFRLLGEGNTDSFYHNLIRSGMARRYYLQRCLDSVSLQDHFRGCGRYQPLCDAIAADDFALANQIVALSPTEFLQHHEYEDDYCYGRILHAVASETQIDSDAVLAQFLSYLEGEETGRFRVAAVLLRPNQTDFDDAFERLLRDRQLEIAADLERGEIESPPILISRRIFIEGLAILRLAERVGLKTEQEYLFCPSIARVPMIRPFPGE